MNKIVYKITKHSPDWYTVGGQNILIESESCSQIYYYFFCFLLISDKLHHIYWADI